MWFLTNVNHNMLDYIENKFCYLLCRYVETLTLTIVYFVTEAVTVFIATMRVKFNWS